MVARERNRLRKIVDGLMGAQIPLCRTALACAWLRRPGLRENWPKLNTNSLLKIEPTSSPTKANNSLPSLT